jgi:rSAM/selenodomain-associated transferase 1
MTRRFALLVVAKAPVPGFAKTRLCPPASPRQAAEIAAAALLDTLDAVTATPGAVPVVAMTGELAEAARSAELAGLLRPSTVLRQRGGDLAERLANAHADTAATLPGLPVLQIGMDTPQVTPDLLAAAATMLSEREAVLGPATDGGWWALGLRDPGAARLLAAVPMSQPHTGDRTLRALSEAGLRAATLPCLSDVDTMADAARVAGLAGGRFAAAVSAVVS